jgi:hypothetical protein
MDTHGTYLQTSLNQAAIWRFQETSKLLLHFRHIHQENSRSCNIYLHTKSAPKGQWPLQYPTAAKIDCWQRLDAESWSRMYQISLKKCFEPRSPINICLLWKVWSSMVTISAIQSETSETPCVQTRYLVIVLISARLEKIAVLNAKMSVRSCFPAWISDDSWIKGPWIWWQTLSTSSHKNDSYMAMSQNLVARR